MSENTDSDESRDTLASGQGEGANLGVARKFRSVMRGLFVSSIVAVLVLVGLVMFMFWTENFEPKTEHIVSMEGWRPFLQGLTQVNNATQNMDDGSIVFTMHPEFEDWNAYFSTLSEDAARTGWVNVPAGDARFFESRYAVKRYVTRLLRKGFDVDTSVRNFFTYEHEPAYDGDSRTLEVVEITLLARSGSVLFVSFYGYE